MLGSRWGGTFGFFWEDDFVESENVCCSANADGEDCLSAVASLASDLSDGSDSVDGFDLVAGFHAGVEHSIFSFEGVGEDLVDDLFDFVGVEGDSLAAVGVASDVGVF